MSKNTDSWYGDPVKQQIKNLFSVASEMNATTLVIALVPDPNNRDAVTSYIYWDGDILWLASSLAFVLQNIQADVADFFNRSEDDMEEGDGEDVEDWWQNLRY